MWENVPGAFSSNRGFDFRTVLEEISETEIPMPDSGKWAIAGLVELSDRQIAWRVLDAQYWGVPQRRKRIFLVTDFRGCRAGEILFKPEGLQGDLTQGRETREGITADSERSVNETSGFGETGIGYWQNGIQTLRVGGERPGSPNNVVVDYMTAWNSASYRWIYGRTGGQGGWHRISGRGIANLKICIEWQ
jgi:site-specific DNA-cytosine methylase